MLETSIENRMARLKALYPLQNLQPGLDPAGFAQRPIIPAPTLGARTLGMLSVSPSGSELVDAGLGAVVGYLVAPRGLKTQFALGGAAATGLAGVTGALGTALVAFFWR